MNRFLRQGGAARDWSWQVFGLARLLDGARLPPLAVTWGMTCWASLDSARDCPDRSWRVTLVHASHASGPDGNLKSEEENETKTPNLITRSA